MKLEQTERTTNESYNDTLKQITLSVNDTAIQRKSEGKDTTGFKVETFNLQSDVDQARLSTYFQSRLFNTNVWNTLKRNDKKAGYTDSCLQKNYIGMYGICIDFDEPGLILDEAKEKFKDYVYIIYTSSSHQVDKPEMAPPLQVFFDLQKRPSLV